jgi:transcriptional regulator with PAS, ATPase and Fis domain
VSKISNSPHTGFTFGRYDKIRLEDLPAPIRGEPEISARTATRATRTGSFAEAERDVIRRALETAKRNKVQTAKLLGISRKKLYTKIKEYGL